MKPKSNPSTKRSSSSPGPRNNGRKPSDAVIPVTQFQAFHFFDNVRAKDVIALYALTEDGVVREFRGDHWEAFPVT